MTPFLLAFGSLVRRNRKYKDMTQAELAKLFSVTRQTIINYEAGTTSPSFILAMQMMKTLDIGYDELPSLSSIQ